jgi:hypothetical protein
MTAAATSLDSSSSRVRGKITDKHDTSSSRRGRTFAAVKSGDRGGHAMRNPPFYFTTVVSAVCGLEEN